jgi:hypothetical protein
MRQGRRSRSSRPLTLRGRSPLAALLSDPAGSAQSEPDGSTMLFTYEHRKADEWSERGLKRISLNREEAAERSRPRLLSPLVGANPTPDSPCVSLLLARSAIPSAQRGRGFKGEGALRQPPPNSLSPHQRANSPLPYSATRRTICAHSVVPVTLPKTLLETLRVEERICSFTKCDRLYVDGL